MKRKTPDPVMAASSYPAFDAPVDARFASVDCLFFVIGAQKAGTTWLSHYLKAHPNVSVPEWKEHDYWNMVEGRPEPSRMLQEQARRRQGFNPLRSLVAKVPFTLHARRQRAVTLALNAVSAPCPPYSAYADVVLANATDQTLAAGEICPEYAILQTETFAKMSALSPNVRFIFLMRDPVSRFLSGVQHGLRKSDGKERGSSAGRVSEAIAKLINTPNSRPLRLSRYDQTMEALEAAVPQDHILYVFFEELFDQKTVKRICEFLGLPFVEGPVERKANSAGREKVQIEPADRALVAAALEPVYSFMAARFGPDLPQRWRQSAALC